MPHVPKNHEDNQMSICGICLAKSKQLRNITDTTLERIRKLDVFKDYNKTEEECGQDWTWLPQKICNPCHGSLTKAWDNEKKRQDEGTEAEPLHRVISHVDHRDLKGPTRLTRDHPLCECSLCEIGRMKNKEYSTFIESIKEPRGRPNELTPKKDPEPMLVCSRCQAPYGPGKPHNCNDNSRRGNVVQVIAESGERTRRQILCDGLREVMTEEGCSKGGTVSLPSGIGGKALTLTRGDVHLKPKVKFPHGALFMLQKKHGFSDKGMKGLCQWLQAHAGRDVIDPYFRDAMYEKNHAFDDFFRHEKVRFQEYYTPAHDIEYGPDGKKKKKPKQQVREVEKSIAYCSDVNAFATEVIAERGLDPDRVVIQIGLDDGQSLIKVKSFTFPNIIMKLKLTVSFKGNDDHQRT